MPWIPDSNSATVREPAGRVAAFSLSSANSVSKFFTPSRLLAPDRAPRAGRLHDGGDVSDDTRCAGPLSPPSLQPGGSFRHRQVSEIVSVLLQGEGGRERRRHGLVALV